MEKIGIFAFVTIWVFSVLLSLAFTGALIWLIIEGIQYLSRH